MLGFSDRRAEVMTYLTMFSIFVQFHSWMCCGVFIQVARSAPPHLFVLKPGPAGVSGAQDRAYVYAFKLFGVAWYSFFWLVFRLRAVIVLGFAAVIYTGGAKRPAAYIRILTRTGEFLRCPGQGV